MFRNVLPFAAVSVVAMATASTASAAADLYFPYFTVPATFGQANTAYAEWDGFNSRSSNAPTADAPTPSFFDAANAYDGTYPADGAILTGDNPPHIYSYMAPITPTISIPEQNLGAGYTTTIIVQIQTEGSEVNPADATLTPAGGSALSPTVPAVLLHQDLEPFPPYGTTANDDYEFIWTVPGNAASYTFSVTGDAPSIAWDGTRVDVAVTPAAVPEPTSVSAIVLTAVGVVGRRRRAR